MKGDEVSPVLPMIRHAMIGSTVAFICRTERFVQWFHKRGELPQNAAIDQIHMVLTIEQLVSINEGPYQCLAYDDSYLHGPMFLSTGWLIINGKLIQVAD